MFDVISIAESTTLPEYPLAPILPARLGFSLPMSERQEGPYDSIARRWLALMERRRAHFIELCDSGRWQHYYTRAQFLDELRKVMRARQQWAALAGVSLEEEGEAAASRDRPEPIAASLRSA